MDDAVFKRSPCWKIPYDHRRDAAAAMAEVKTRNNKKRHKASVFLCPICGKWHWGHKLQGRK